MSAKPVVLRELAKQDIDGAVRHYLPEQGKQSALGFIDALEQALAYIGRQPASGSPRYAHELDLPGLRSWMIRSYPYIVFYVEAPDCVDIWRVLHGARDIPASLSDIDEASPAKRKDV